VSAGVYTISCEDGYITHSITTDTWTASSNCSYMGVTAHWLDDNLGTHNKSVRRRASNCRLHLT